MHWSAGTAGAGATPPDGGAGSRAPARGEAAPERALRLPLTGLRAVQITRFGGPEVVEIIAVPEPVAGPGQELFDVSTAGINFADTHHRLS